MKNRKVIIISVIVSSISIISGSINWNVQFAVVGLVFFLAGLFYSPNIGKKIKFYLIVALPFLPYTILVVFEKLIHVYPIAFAPYFALVLGLLVSCQINRLRVKYIAVVFYLILMIISYKYIMPNYLIYIFDKEFIAIENEKQDFPEISIYYDNGEKVDLNAFEGKVLVLDLWTTKCGVCFKKFPEFEILAKEYAGRSDINFFALNNILKIDKFDSVVAMANALPYDFEHLFTTHKSVGEIKDKLFTNSFPTIIIKDKKGKLVFLNSTSAFGRNYYRNARDVIAELLAKD